MKPYAKIIAASLLGMTAISQAATIAGGNGSFETVTTGAVAYGGTYGQIFYLNEASFSGWTYTERVNDVNGAVWLMADTTYGAASDGNNQVNLISDGTSYFLSTTISGLTVGNSYTVNFDARQRSGGGGTFDVVVDTTVPTGGFDITPTSTTWAQQSITFTATAANHTLSIANYDYATGAVTTSGNGLFVDNFSVVPEPSAALLGGLGMLCLLRRRRS